MNTEAFKLGSYHSSEMYKNISHFQPGILHHVVSIREEQPEYVLSRQLQETGVLLIMNQGSMLQRR